MGIHEMKGALLQEDLDSWAPFTDWLAVRSRPSVVAEEPPAGSEPGSESGQDAMPAVSS